MKTCEEVEVSGRLYAPTTLPSGALELRRGAKHNIESTVRSSFIRPELEGLRFINLDACIIEAEFETNSLECVIQRKYKSGCWKRKGIDMKQRCRGETVYAK
jgi:hypothetical protein